MSLCLLRVGRMIRSRCHNSVFRPHLTVPVVGRPRFPKALECVQGQANVLPEWCGVCVGAPKNGAESISGASIFRGVSISGGAFISKEAFASTTRGAIKTTTFQAGPPQVDYALVPLMRPCSEVTGGPGACALVRLWTVSERMASREPTPLSVEEL